MGKSLADQLLGAGLVDEKKAKKIKKEKRKQDKQVPKGALSEAEERRARLQREREAAAERDRERNRQRVAAEEAKARRAQVRQMLQQHGQPVDGEIRFNFVDPRSNKVKQLYVNTEAQNHLARGNLAICAHGDDYTVVPANVAAKIAERVAEALIFRATPDASQPDEDDPYKDYPIPDDLMW